MYLQILNVKSDSREILMQIYIIVSLKGKRKEFLVADGDAKPDELLHSLKYEYGDELEWLLPYPRDWHTHSRVFR